MTLCSSLVVVGCDDGDTAPADTDVGSTGAADPSTGTPGETDMGTDAGSTGGSGTDTDAPDPVDAVAGCGAMEGLLAGAAWPAPGYCSAHPRQSPRPFPTQGTVGWTFDPGGGQRINHAPVVADDGSIYVTVSTDTTPVDLIKLDAAGQELWRYQTTDTGQQGESGSPVLTAQGVVVFANHEEVFAANPDGTPAWSVPLAQTLADGDLAVGHDGTVYVAAGSLVAIGPDGTTRWTGTEEGIYMLATAVNADGDVYAFGDDELYDQGSLFKYSPDGDQLWSVEAFGDAGGVYLSPMIDEHGDVVLSLYGGTYALTKDGSVRWGYPQGPGSLFEPWGNTLLPDGRVVITAYDGGQGDYVTAVVSGGGLGGNVDGCDEVVMSDANGNLLCRGTEGGIRAMGAMEWHVDVPTGDARNSVDAAMGEDTLYVNADGVLVAITG